MFLFLKCVVIAIQKSSLKNNAQFSRVLKLCTSSTPRGLMETHLCFWPEGPEVALQVSSHHQLHNDESWLPLGDHAQETNLRKGKARAKPPLPPGAKPTHSTHRVLRHMFPGLPRAISIPLWGPLLPHGAKPSTSENRPHDPQTSPTPPCPSGCLFCIT